MNLVVWVKNKNYLTAIYLIAGTCKIIEVLFTINVMHIVRSSTAFYITFSDAWNRDQVDQIAGQLNL